MTAHRAKGLEFRHVIVMDCCDWDRSEDERRLLYVSMTRAKETSTSVSPVGMGASIGCMAIFRIS